MVGPNPFFVDEKTGESTQLPQRYRWFILAILMWGLYRHMFRLKLFAPLMHRILTEVRTICSALRPFRYARCNTARSPTFQQSNLFKLADKTAA
jgi:hypothetical protein